MHKFHLYAKFLIISTFLALTGGSLNAAVKAPLALSMPGGPEFLVLFIGLFGIVGTIVWIVALVDLLKNDRLQGTDKIVWVLVVILLQFIGAVIYFCMAPRGPRSS
jgi:hypothetical protein